LSDIVAELDAAHAAGMQTGLVVRPGNAAVPTGHGHPVLENFAQLELA
jgi:methionine salvage enolase-phosphatase E1